MLYGLSRILHWIPRRVCISMSSVKKSKIEYWNPEKKRKYENVMDFLIKEIEKIENKLFEKSGTHIIRRVEKRLKSQESIEEKIKRKNKDNCAEVEEIINDLAGVRVICFDTRQVYTLAKEIKKIKEIDVIKEKDYISHPKENGYQSYHMIIVFLGLKVELQIRTILMDAWSSLETVLIYKKSNNPPKEVVDKIRRFSRWSKKMDHMVEEMLEKKG